MPYSPTQSSTPSSARAVRALAGAAAAIVGLLVMGGALAEPATVSPEYLATIRDDETPLPRNRAPWERALAPLAVRGASIPPLAPVYTPPEYARNESLMIRWGSFNSLLTEMVVAITSVPGQSRVLVVVSGASQQSSASSTLQGAGADLARVDFLVTSSDSVWIRDYGPRMIDEQYDRAIVDHTYNRPRPNDDNVPTGASSYLGAPLFDIGLVHGGGNFHLFGNRDAFMTDLILNENPGLDEATIKQRYLDYQGLNLEIVQAFPTSFDATQHIDMWMLPVSDTVAIVGEYAQGTGIPYTTTEATVDVLENRGYTVLRTPGWQAGGDHFTYTNAVVLNEVVLTCRFNGYETQNAEALAVFQAAFPNREIAQVDCTTIIQYAGAIHCIVMHIPLPDRIFASGEED